MDSQGSWYLLNMEEEVEAYSWILALSFVCPLVGFTSFLVFFYFLRCPLSPRGHAQLLPDRASSPKRIASSLYAALYLAFGGQFLVHKVNDYLCFGVLSRVKRLRLGALSLRFYSSSWKQCSVCQIPMLCQLSSNLTHELYGFCKWCLPDRVLFTLILSVC